MITNPIGKTEGAGVGGISFSLVLRRKKFLEIRFIDSYEHEYNMGIWRQFHFWMGM